MITPTSNVISSPTEGAQAKEKNKMADAARQFEALLISQLLKSACDASTMAGTVGQGDAAGATAVEMAQEQFAAALSARGGMGLATMVTSSLHRDQE